MFHNPLSSLAGIGPAKAALLASELGLETWGDLLNHFPFRYDDRTVFYLVKDLDADMQTAQLRGIIMGQQLITTGKIMRLVATLVDGDGNKLQLVWFNSIRFWQQKMPLGHQVVVYGKPNFFRGMYSIIHPEITVVAGALAIDAIATDNSAFTNLGTQSSETENTIPALSPVYSLTEKLRKKGIDSQVLGKLVQLVYDHTKQLINENMPLTVVEQYQFLDRTTAYQLIHFPTDYAALEAARYRLKFEELFFNQLRLIRVRGLRKQQLAGWPMSKLKLFTAFYNDHLPFQLTNAQQRVLREIRQDMGSGRQMNRLIQGDVGSGKTIVAFMSMLMAVDNGCQACLMAPTEILAEQHLNGLQPLANAIGLPIAKLTGSTKAKDRKPILEALASGVLPLIVGTHALLEPKVHFQRLGLSVIDEQHRFGVAQRARLWDKNSRPDQSNELGIEATNLPEVIAPHIMVMTATPIPRTLAMTLYGDLDVSVIDELPPGRKPIRTSHVYQSQRQQAWHFMQQQIADGRQIYVVYPLIEENEKLDFMALELGYQMMQAHFNPMGIAISMVHGKMPKETRDYEMDQFVKGRTQIMVATTVIEVGVNVPNASVMLIESAERFGLSQLHQLRGRVGRGADQSYCILMTDVKLSSETRERLATMVRTNNGFEIAEVDLKLRGPGDILGTQQSGAVDLKLANLATDMGLMTQARDVATQIIEHDPDLTEPEHIATAEYLAGSAATGLAWSRVG
jgi:ATP-dependent DNA helicase RecG